MVDRCIETKVIWDRNYERRLFCLVVVETACVQLPNHRETSKGEEKMKSIFRRRPENGRLRTGSNPKETKMKLKFFSFFALLALILSACGGGVAATEPPASVPAT